jgi:hypothetical protein
MTKFTFLGATKITRFLGVFQQPAKVIQLLPSNVSARQKLEVSYG